MFFYKPALLSAKLIKQGVLHQWDESCVLVSVMGRSWSHELVVSLDAVGLALPKHSKEYLGFPQEKTQGSIEILQREAVKGCIKS